MMRNLYRPTEAPPVVEVSESVLHSFLLAMMANTLLRQYWLWTMLQSHDRYEIRSCVEFRSWMCTALASAHSEFQYKHIIENLQFGFLHPQISFSTIFSARFGRGKMRDWGIPYTPIQLPHSSTPLAHSELLIKGLLIYFYWRQLTTSHSDIVAGWSCSMAQLTRYYPACLPFWELNYWMSWCSGRYEGA